MGLPNREERVVEVLDIQGYKRMISNGDCLVSLSAWKESE
jgi:hypothetical protein